MRFSLTPPALIFESEAMPANTAGTAKFFWIKLRKAYAQDAGLLAHELLHVTQFWRLAWLAIPGALLLAHFGIEWQWAGLLVSTHPLLATFVPAYRLLIEVECYREQAKHYKDDRLPLFAKFISANYELNITPEQALQKLRND